VSPNRILAGLSPADLGLLEPNLEPVDLPVRGYTAEEIVGKPITSLIPPEQQDEEPRILARIKRGERVESYETVRQRKDGRRIAISLAVSPIIDAPTAFFNGSATTTYTHGGVASLQKTQAPQATIAPELARYSQRSTGASSKPAAEFGYARCHSIH